MADERLHLLADGTVTVEFKRPWSDGTRSFGLALHALISRMAALVPPLRRHVTAYSGVLASNSRFPVRPATRNRNQTAAGTSPGMGSCGGRLRLIALVKKEEAIQALLKAMGLPTQAMCGRAGGIGKGLRFSYPLEKTMKAGYLPLALSTALVVTGCATDPLPRDGSGGSGIRVVNQSDIAVFANVDLTHLGTVPAGQSVDFPSVAAGLRNPYIRQIPTLSVVYDENITVAEGTTFVITLEASRFAPMIRIVNGAAAGTNCLKAVYSGQSLNGQTVSNQSPTAYWFDGGGASGVCGQVTGAFNLPSEGEYSITINSGNIAVAGGTTLRYQAGTITTFDL